MHFLFSGIQGPLAKIAMDYNLIKKTMPSYWYKDGIEPCLKQTTLVVVDSDTTVPVSKVDEIFTYLSQFGEVVRVWHANRGIKTWYEYLEKHKYIGMSALDGFTIPFMQKLVIDAYKKGVKVHGFGCGTPATMKEVPFYSVDASSPFMSIGMYGRVSVFNPKTMSFSTIKLSQMVKGEIDSKYARLQCPEQVKLRNENLPKFFEAVKTAVGAFQEAETFFTRLWKMRGLDWEAI